jgi:endonuclease/exonuclease/phosphatase family metal-dependent hydrolase
MAAKAEEKKASFPKIKSIKDVKEKLEDIVPTDLFIFDADDTLIESSEPVFWPWFYKRPVMDVFNNFMEDKRKGDPVFYNDYSKRAPVHVVEPAIVEFIKAVQAKGANVIVLSAIKPVRDKEGKIIDKGDWRLEQLRSIGLDFSGTYPGLEISPPSFYNNGMILPGDKVFKKDSVMGLLDALKSKGLALPTRIFFFDDLMKSVEFVKEAADKYGIAYVGYNYLAAMNDRDDSSLDLDMMKRQLQYMVRENRYVPYGSAEAEKEVISKTDKVKLMTYNMCNTDIDERYPYSKWSNTRDRKKEIIEGSGADFVCLQEHRVRDGTPEEWLSSIKGYRFVIGYNKPTPDSMAQSILYDPKKWILGTTTKHWLSETPDKFSRFPEDGSGGRIVIGCHFFNIYSGRDLYVFCTHFGVDEKAKTKCSDVAVRIVRTVAGDKPSVIAGDFNFYDGEKGNDAASQRKFMESYFVDMGKKMITTEGKELGGTFIGYSHDNYAKGIVPTASTKRVDHVYGRDVKQIGDAKLDTRTMTKPEIPELSDRDKLPSDHLPLSVEFEFS